MAALGAMATLVVLMTLCMTTAWSQLLPSSPPFGAGSILESAGANTESGGGLASLFPSTNSRPSYNKPPFPYSASHQRPVQRPFNPLLYFFMFDNFF